MIQTNTWKSVLDEKCLIQKDLIEKQKYQYLHYGNKEISVHFKSTH